MAVPPHSALSVSGLCWLKDGLHLQQVPLQNVRVDATLYDLCAEIKVHQTYVHNLHTQEYAHALSSSNIPLECVYIFPLDEESAVFSFVAYMDGVVVEGRIREKMEARAEYNSALARNRSAMLLEQSSENVFRMKVGNLKPGSVCTITLTYLTLLDQQGRHNRLTLPMIVAPKYSPSNGGPTPLFAPLQSAPHNTIHKGYHCHHCLCSPIIGTRHSCDTCTYDLCHGCHMQHDMGHHIVPIAGPSCDLPTPSRTTLGSKLRDLTMKLTITMPSPIVSIECPSHPTETQITHTKDLPSHANALFHSKDSCSLSNDFILLVEQQRCFDPRVLCELDMAHHTAAVSLAFMPPPVDMLSASQIQCELIFLIDCSGSMNGSSITCVRECMQLLLRSLPVHSHFNIITFGSTWSSVFPSSQAYDDTSLSAASQYISRLQADLGGTEIYRPLLHALTRDMLPAHPRQVFLLTDGQVSNVEQLVRLTSQHAVSTRLFTFGIGAAVDRLLCKKLAQAGRGKCEFVTAEDGGDAGMREKVVRQVARAMQPVLTDVKVDWGQLKAPALSALASTSFLQCPSTAPAIFMSSRYILHALNVSLPDSVWRQAEAGQAIEFNSEITITAQSNHPHEKDVMRHSVVLSGEQISQACVIHTLAAKERIRGLENQVQTSSSEAKKGLEDEILQLGLKHTLSSSRTSFVAVYNAGSDGEIFEETAPFCDAESGKDIFCTNGWASNYGPRGSRALFPLAQRRNLHKMCTGTALLNAQGGFAWNEGVDDECFVKEQCASMASIQRTMNVCMPCSAPSGNVQILQGASFGSRSAYAQPEAACTTVAFGNAPAGNSLKCFMPSGVAPICGAAVPLSMSFEGSQVAVPLQLSFGSSSMRECAPWKDAKATAFESLIQLQSAKGVWQITPMLVDIVHAIIPLSFPTITMQALSAISKERGVDEAVVGVMVALQLLETEYKHRRAEWEMLAMKALFFLNEDAKISAKLQEDIKESIAKLLGD